jgi:hypothetical protein
MLQAEANQIVRRVLESLSNGGRTGFTSNLDFETSVQMLRCMFKLEGAMPAALVKAVLACRFDVTPDIRMDEYPACIPGKTECPVPAKAIPSLRCNVSPGRVLLALWNLLHPLPNGDGKIELLKNGTYLSSPSDGKYELVLSTEHASQDAAASAALILSLTPTERFARHGSVGTAVPARTELSSAACKWEIKSIGSVVNMRFWFTEIVMDRQ